jgi:hypothetical protein
MTNRRLVPDLVVCYADRVTQTSWQLSLPFVNPDRSGGICSFFSPPTYSIEKVMQIDSH